MLSLYERIKEYRQKNEWSQEELAKRVGYSDKSMISRIENGKIDLSRSQIAKFAEVFGVSISDLIGDDGTEAVYYTNPETAKLAQELFEDKDLRVLFDAARGSRPENLLLAAEMLKRMKETNPDG